ncbi:cupin domain-containing protein [soil metagenome]
MYKINLAEKFSKISEFYKPKLVGELNGQHVKIAKLKGEFIWHKHDNEDEMFLIIKGKLLMELRGENSKVSNIELNEGEFLIVPRGVEHKPVADEEVHLMLFEPAGTLNTGDVENERTVKDVEKI